MSPWRRRILRSLSFLVLLATGLFAIGFLVAGVVVLASIPSALRMRPETGAQVSGHRG